jgi:hypothetical protein
MPFSFSSSCPIKANTQQKNLTRESQRIHQNITQGIIIPEMEM